MRRWNLKLLLITVLFISKIAIASVTLPKIIGSNMVLQRNKPMAIWGNADAGENITVSFHGQVKQATANPEGKWMVMLDAMPADAKPSMLEIKGKNTIRLDNILVGEVWLCSGQSNMQYTMTKQTHFANAKRSIGLDSAALSHESNDNIRLFLVVRDLTKPDGGHVNKGWNPANGAPLGAFSAAGYFFAKRLYDSLHIPIGMIASSVSGSNIDPWLDGDPVTTTTGGKAMYSIDTTKPGKFHHGMIEPLSPYTLRGFLWYQGETNSFLGETAVYSYKFRHLITTWRNLWHNANAPFYFVQIAPFEYSKGGDGKVKLTEQALPQFRKAQEAALSLPHTGMVVTTDLVDKVQDLHPTYKWIIGQRLADLALTNDYGFKKDPNSPAFTNMSVNGNRIEVVFDHAASGLKSIDEKPITGFEIAGKNGAFVPASAVIDGKNKVKVMAAGVDQPTAVRFGWNEAAQPNLFNSNGLPAVPFNTAYQQP